MIYVIIIDMTIIVKDYNTFVIYYYINVIELILI